MKVTRSIALPLGGAYLIVVIATVASNLLLGGISDSRDILTEVLEKSAYIRFSILLDLLSSVGIVVLAVLLYTILKEQNQILALFGLGWWIAESVVLASSKIHFLSILALGQDLTEAASSDATYYRILSTSYLNAAQSGYVVVLLFFSLGGMAFYYLFHKSGLIPKILSMWGFFGAVLACGAGVSALLGAKPPNLIFAINVLFELFIGLWLIVKGLRPSNTKLGL